MLEAYWETVRTNPFDRIILGLGLLLIAAHFVGLVGYCHARRVFFVQNLDRYRTVLLVFTELLPVLGLLGTVFSLMYTFKTFQTAGAEGSPDLSQMVQTFAPAMSTTISGLLMLAPNLVLNAIMWTLSPTPEKGQGQS